MKENQEYKNEGLAALKGHWPQAVLATLVVALLGCVCTIPYIIWAVKTAAIGSDPTDLQAALAYMGGMYRNLFVSYVLIFLVVGPLVVGLVNAFKELLFSYDGKIVSNSFRIGYGSYWRHMWGFLLKNIFIFLWSLLFVIPGIIKQLSYAMTNYILVDHPELSANQAINRSKDMMYGHKFDLFYPYLTFAGWFLLSMLTLGIGILWFYPYVEAAQASFYRDVRDDYERRMNAAPAQPAPASVQPPVAPTVSRAENPEDYMPKSE